jgi:hypothetical protein
MYVHVVRIVLRRLLMEWKGGGGEGGSKFPEKNISQ